MNEIKDENSVSNTHTSEEKKRAKLQIPFGNLNCKLNSQIVSSKSEFETEEFEYIRYTL